jgi:hypothetical protein
VAQPGPCPLEVAGLTTTVTDALGVPRGTPLTDELRDRALTLPDAQLAVYVLQGIYLDNLEFRVYLLPPQR